MRKPTYNQDRDIYWRVRTATGGSSEKYPVADGDIANFAGLC